MNLICLNSGSAYYSIVVNFKSPQFTAFLKAVKTIYFIVRKNQVAQSTALV